jgi:hypothetical protein
MVILMLCVLFLTACAPIRHTPQRKVYYDLGLGSADHITVLAQTGPVASERFAVFFRAFSTEFEASWPYYCPGPPCLAKQWQITLEEVERGSVKVTLAEQGGKTQAFLWRRFTSEDLGGVKLFAGRLVRAVIELLARVTRRQQE